MYYKEADETIDIQYNEWPQAFYFIFKVMVGAIEEGAESKNEVLNTAYKVLFLLITVYLNVIALNFLIALMGDIFNRNQQTQLKNKLRQQLALIVENWRILEFFHFRDESYKRVKYIVAAFSANSIEVDVTD